MAFDAGWLSILMASDWFPVIAGTLIQVFAVQRVKFWLPLHWTDFTRSRAIEGLGLLLGFTSTMSLYWVAHGCTALSITQGLWLAIMVALTGPFIYKLTSRFIYARYPELEGRLSAHGRALKARNGAIP